MEKRKKRKKANESSTTTQVHDEAESEHAEQVSYGAPVFTLPTLFGGLQTDIPQDFSISALSGGQSGPITQVTIPAGVSFLFVTANDSFYGDNYSKDLALHISAVPEPSPIVSLSSGLISLALLLRRKLML